MMVGVFFTYHSAVQKKATYMLMSIMTPSYRGRVKNPTKKANLSVSGEKKEKKLLLTTNAKLLRGWIKAKSSISIPICALLIP